MVSSDSGNWPKGLIVGGGQKNDKRITSVKCSVVNRLESRTWPKDLLALFGQMM